MPLLRHRPGAVCTTAKHLPRGFKKTPHHDVLPNCPGSPQSLRTTFRGFHQRTGLLLWAPLLLLAACSQGRVGYIIDADGTMQRQTPQTIRAADQRRLAAALADGLPTDQNISVDLGHDPLPVITSDEQRVWRYPALAVTIRLDEALSAPDQADLETRTRRLLRRLQRERGAVITIAVTMADPQPAPQPVTPWHDPAQPVWRYSIIEGDTLALIAAAFYGDAGRWRLLLDANPGLDPSDLQPGMSIIIPPLPDTTP